ncbi:SAM-dependent methyltransferase [Sphaerisporangium melleum]|uniref:SAM-dependent methyltransferase n=1 Tax=Sphaerisporangium melleum TaxID=321316 RepID=A0A917REY1_9ACTN|nr:N-6 DNA methylase [Sphaerisporangium melleum]GGL05002.1 SAM-dependent methyltransferase [Sphaerisporangium melleum]GII73946.1 SAM-dependent methyltransferase [Sphaerisporangium melleum]
MRHDATLNAGDIARLADVGRAAVSNWRRRYDDFPQPVGGTAASPLFSLPEVEDWLRRNGKPYEMSPADRVWQRLRASGDDLRLGDLVGCAGAFLLFLLRDPEGRQAAGRAREPAERLHRAAAAATADLPVPVDWSMIDLPLYRLLADLAGEHGPREAFELLCERYIEAHSRLLSVTRADLADLMARLAAPLLGGPADDAPQNATGAPPTVFDPACGVGALLLPFTGARVLAQDGGETAALLTAVRLLLGGARAQVVAGDSLRLDGFPALRADVVVCDPPFNERAWGYEELTGDPRWEYGLPPRGEPELAWVQHCLAHTRPGGLVAVLMPPAAASRRPGKRIRGNLLRAGALRAVMTPVPGGPDLWLLRRPRPGERAPSQVLMVDAAESTADAEAAWRAFAADPEGAPPAPGRAVRIIDLLDDEVDLSPARHRLLLGAREAAAEFGRVRERFAARAAALEGALPHVAPPAEGHEPPTTTIGELVRAGMVTVHQGPAKMATDAGDLPVLTAADLLSGGAPSGRTTGDPGHVVLEPGDVVSAVLAEVGAARTVTEAGAVLGPHLYLYRVDRERIDPDFLAGCLRHAAGAARAHPGASRVDARRVRVPRLSLAEQREYGRAFRELLALEDRLRATAELGERLVRLGFDGLVGGHLRPGG